VQPHGGYKGITVVQLCNGLHAYDAGLISFRALRVYFAAFAAVATREAARRSVQARGRRPSASVRYRVQELAELAGIGCGEVRGLVRRLERVGLIAFSESAITPATEPLPEAEDFALAAAGKGRSPRRFVPVPRPMLRLLARSTRPSFAKVAVAYLIRGLSRARGTSVLRAAGSAKATWISRVFGLSERAARYARRDLIRLDVISADGGSSQRKLNRDGAYFTVNLAWGPDAYRDPSEEKIAPRDEGNARRFAPPWRDGRTSSELKNQKTLAQEASGGRCRSGEGKPSLGAIRPGDLRRVSSVMSLYDQATAAGWLERSEANLRNFVAAAVRATQARGDSVRIFVAIVKRRLWHHITMEQEERAARAMTRRLDARSIDRTERGLGPTVAALGMSRAGTSLDGVFQKLRPVPRATDAPTGGEHRRLRREIGSAATAATGRDGSPRSALGRSPA
jgi:hypothetical protein